MVPEKTDQKKQALDLSQILHDTCWRQLAMTLAGDNWRFHCIVKNKEGNKKPL